MDVPENDRLGIHKRRQETWRWKEELHRLQTRKAELLDNEVSCLLTSIIKSIHNEPLANLFLEMGIFAGCF